MLVFFIILFSFGGVSLLYTNNLCLIYYLLYYIYYFETIYYRGGQYTVVANFFTVQFPLCPTNGK
jgi:hypothetical protein